MKRPSLTPKQARFVEEYLIDCNGTAAAIRAGYARVGAHVTASRLLRNTKVDEAIRAGQAETRGMLKMDRQRVVAELLRAVHLAQEQANPAAMVNGLREVARLGGYYPDQLVAVAAPSVATKALEERLSRMSDEQLEAIITAGEP
jgi:phage terminase small subunit